MIRLCHCQHNGDREGESKCSDSPGNPVVWLSCSGIAASNPRALSNQCRILVFLSGLWCATALTWTKGSLRIRRLAVEQIWTPMQTLPVKLSGEKSQDCPQTPSHQIISNPHNLRWSVEVHRSSFLSSPSIARSMCCKHGLLPTATSSKLGAGACEGFSFFRSGPLPAARFCGGRTGHKWSQMVTSRPKMPKTPGLKLHFHLPSLQWSPSRMDKIWVQLGMRHPPSWRGFGSLQLGRGNLTGLLMSLAELTNVDRPVMQMPSAWCPAWHSPSRDHSSLIESAHWAKRLYSLHSGQLFLFPSRRWGSQQPYLIT